MKKKFSYRGVIAIALLYLRGGVQGDRDGLIGAVGADPGMTVADVNRAIKHYESPTEEDTITNAACIGLLVGQSDTDTSPERIEEVREAARALAEFEVSREPNFWENTKLDWESLCASVADRIVQRKRTADWKRYFRSVLL